MGVRARVIHTDVPSWFKVKSKWQLSYEKTLERDFADWPKGFYFHGEELRVRALECGLAHPDHHNHWGAAALSIITKWKSQGLIKDTGLWAPATGDKAHGRKYQLYQKT
jgi:hypothetical protein